MNEVFLEAVLIFIRGHGLEPNEVRIHPGHLRGTAVNLEPNASGEVGKLGNGATVYADDTVLIESFRVRHPLGVTEIPWEGRFNVILRALSEGSK